MHESCFLSTEGLCWRSDVPTIHNVLGHSNPWTPFPWISMDSLSKWLSFLTRFWNICSVLFLCTWISLVICFWLILWLVLFCLLLFAFALPTVCWLSDYCLFDLEPAYCFEFVWLVSLKLLYNQLHMSIMWHIVCG